MINKCPGCGAIIDNDKNICKRCFDLKNYNKYEITNRNNEDYLKIIDEINNTNDLVIYVASLFNLESINNINKLFKNKVLLVLTKRDILPKSVKDYKLINYIKNMNIKYEDVIIVSSINNYNIDELFNKISKYKKSNNVYFVGKTNSGKSTLINKITKNYSDNINNVTASMYPNTTLDLITVPINNNLNIIDTPGLIDEGNIMNYIDLKDIKKITPKKEIKPKTRKVSQSTSFIIDNIVRIDYLSNKENSLTFYMNNNLKLDNVSLNNNKLNNYCKKSFNLNNNQDIVIDDLCFIKITKSCVIDVYAIDNVNVYVRDNLI